MAFSWWLAFIRGTLYVLPQSFKAALYSLASRISARLGYEVYWNIFRLPCNLVIKATSDATANEAHALRLVGSIPGVHAPQLIDYVSTPSRTYILMTWIEGECCTDVWDRLTRADKDRLVAELRTQFKALREHTASQRHLICNASGSPISDPRLPWVQENPEIFSSSQAFFEQVWLGLDYPRLSTTIRPTIQPLVERLDVPIVFCHGDMAPKNLILPGSLEKWRKGSAGPVHLIDWEYAGWMPLPWEALKATWIVCDQDDEWYVLMRDVFSESASDLDADWLWRSKSNITIL